MRAGRKTVIVRLDADLHRRLKVLAAEQEESIQALVSDAIWQLVEESSDREPGYAPRR